MNLFSPSIIKELFLKYNAKPSKGLGQNFLIDKNVLEKIINSADIKPENIILEVGPGIGTLTQELATRLRQGYGEAKKNSGRVVAIEKDRTMIEILKETLKDFKDVEVVNADILKLNAKPYTLNPYKVVANIPYYLTSPLIRKFLESDNPPQEMVLMLQKEVAQRICAKPPQMSLLAVSVQFYAEPKIVSYVSKNCFWPAPKVDSAIVKITPRCPTSHQEVLCRTSPELFFKIVKAGFLQPRKQLVNNLTTLKFLNGVKLDKAKISAWLFKNNIKPNQRSETLTVSDWINLTKSFKTLNT